MALLTSEVQRLRAEMGYNVLSVGVEPYIGYVQVFNQVIVPYLNAGAITTSSTTVVAASPAAPVALLLTVPTGFVSGDSVVVDVDSRQERATIESLSGSSATVLLSQPHTGTYAVTQEGGEAIVRDILRRLYTIVQIMDGRLAVAGASAVDEIRVETAKGLNPLDMLKAQRLYWRRELASVLGIPLMWDVRSGATQGGGSVEMY